MSKCHTYQKTQCKLYSAYGTTDKPKRNNIIAHHYIVLRFSKRLR